MNREFQQYRFARIEAHNVAGARLKSQFMSGRIDFEKLERAIEKELAEPTTCAPWRRSEMEEMGCRDGARMAALEFFWARRHEFRREGLATAVEPPHFSGAIDSQCKISKPTGPDVVAVPGDPATRH